MEPSHSAVKTPASPFVSPISSGAAASRNAAGDSDIRQSGDGAPALGYAGDVAPGQAWQLVQSGQAVLVDVRTAEELHWVGRVPGALHIEWATGRDQVRNENFLAQLAGAVARERQVLFLCRSGARSVSAARAATQAGYESAWNVLQGFEGPIDAQMQRGRIGGWRTAGLPWQQS